MADKYVIPTPVLPQVPEFQEPDEGRREAILEWYLDHREAYTKTWNKLRDIRQLWPLYTHEQQVAVAKASALFSILSINVNLPKAEAAFSAVMDGMSIRDAMSADLTGDGAAGSQNQRTDWGLTTIGKHHMWEQIVDFLNMDRVDTAHDMILSGSKGLRATKAGFTLANLGFVKKMCLDRNVVNVFFGGETPGDLSVETYDSLCADFVDFFPELQQRLEPYEIQWLVFDWQRTHRVEGGAIQAIPDVGEEVATHDEWFEYAIDKSHITTRRMRDLTRDAIRMGFADPVPGIEVEPPQEEDFPEEDLPPEAFEQGVKRSVDRDIMFRSIDAAIRQHLR